MTRTASRDTARDRLLSSLLLAVLLHALVFVALELFLKLMPTKPVEYHGPIMVQLEELPTVQQASQAAQQAAASAAPPAPGQAQAPAAGVTAAAAAAPTVATEPPLPSGPPLRTAAPAAEASAPTGSPLRFGGARAQPGPTQPSGQGFQVTSSEPTLPPAGAPAQGTPLRAVAPGEGAARPGSQASAVPLEKVDRALASGARQGGGAAGAQGGTGTSAVAQSGAGQGAASREGISIIFDKPDLGRDPTYTPKPDIPKWVSDAGLRLTLDISFELTPQGVLDKVKIVKSCGYNDVDWAVLVAVRRWKFKAAPDSAGNLQGKVGYLILPR